MVIHLVAVTATAGAFVCKMPSGSTQAAYLGILAVHCVMICLVAEIAAWILLVFVRYGLRTVI
jgi:hypothetical protein